VAKYQTRRSTSIKRTIYERLEDFSRVDGRSVSAILEEWINQNLDERGASHLSEEDVARVLTPRTKKPAEKKDPPDPVGIGGVHQF